MFATANLIVIFGGQQPLTALMINLGAAALMLAVCAYLARVPKAAKDLVQLHAALTRKCAELTRNRNPYLAVGASRTPAVHVERMRKFLVPTYQVTVGEPSDDSDYDPVTMRNVNFLTACFYSTSPGVADVRKFTEVASMQGNDHVTLMDAPPAETPLRYAVKMLRASRELNFATVEELAEIMAILDKAEPIETEGTNP
ncbi:hypothetical protein [Nocardia sp. NBC_01327]|uniref:hypothetical protein n=1 Tax=Nocardia sp. NBC_01327 TaxID=2903593 RepID=UPI002E12890C|nr:hypothetical protein OG326_23565 [Nocardia sp. NBC_01327]